MSWATRSGGSRPPDRRQLSPAPRAALKPLLSQFIDEESLDADLVQFGLNGELSLNDVKLNTGSALVRGLELPLHVAAAYAQSLKVKVSWANLISAPIRVEVSGLYVVCTPEKVVLGSDRLESELASIDAVVGALADLASGGVAGRAPPAAAAAVADPHVAPASRAQGERPGRERARSPATPARPPARPRAGKSTVMRILSRVSDLVEVSVANVHVRFEVPAGANAAPAFSLGLCLAELGVFSTDARGARVSAGAAAAGAENMSYVRKTLQARATNAVSVTLTRSHASSSPPPRPPPDPRLCALLRRR